MLSLKTHISFTCKVRGRVECYRRVPHRLHPQRCGFADSRADGSTRVVHVSSDLGRLSVSPQPYQDLIRNAQSLEELFTLPFYSSDDASLQHRTLILDCFVAAVLSFSCPCIASGWTSVPADASMYC
jgi:hypothetical protein